ncbi:MAG: excisionase, partial [Sphingomonadales bacterium GWF1_63_6]
DSPPEPLTVRIPAAIRMTGIGRSKLYELIQSGDIEIAKIGSSTLIPVESLRQLINRNRR